MQYRASRIDIAVSVLDLETISSLRLKALDTSYSMHQMILMFSLSKRCQIQSLTRRSNTSLDVLDDLVSCLKAMVGRGGLEPPTSRLSGVRSNHLSYRPNLWRASLVQRRGLVEPIGIEPMTS